MKAAFIVLFMMLVCSGQSQIPVEVFVGHERSTLDIMFFKFLNQGLQADGQKKRWLFFNRNRASMDYRMTKSTFLPQFGFTEAISYNHEKLKGFAPVVVGQVLSWGVFPKAGIQYAHINKKVTFFSWIVCETLNNPELDYFLLFRYTPPLGEKLHLFTQFEMVNTIPTNRGENYSFTQRVRIGLQSKEWQYGLGVDLNQTGNQTWSQFFNAGGFIRQEF